MMRNKTERRYQPDYFNSNSASGGDESDRDGICVYSGTKSDLNEGTNGATHATIPVNEEALFLTRRHWRVSRPFRYDKQGMHREVAFQMQRAIFFRRLTSE